MDKYDNVSPKTSMPYCTHNASFTLAELNGRGEDKKQSAWATKQDSMRDHGCAAVEEQHYTVYWHLLPNPNGVPQYIAIDYDEKTEDLLPRTCCLLPAIWKEQLLPHTFSETK